MRKAVERYFGVRERGSTLRTELLGGLTTFVTMAYILVANPAILQGVFAADGIGVGPLTVATALSCVVGCLLMGLYANRPIAVAPYMGENAFIAFSLGVYLIDGRHITWQERLGSVFVAGAVFFVLTLLRLRSWLADAISPSMKYAFAVGIGLFLFLVGVTETGIVTNGLTGSPVSNLPVEDGRLLAPGVPPLKIGDLRDARVLLAVFGFVLITTLLSWNVRGGILLGIVATAALGIALGHGEPPRGVVAVPWSAESDLSRLAFRLDIVNVLKLGFLPVLLTLILISFLDTLGTLFAVGSAAGWLDERGNFPEIEKPMLVDSLSCMASALVGTSTSGAYIESTTGVREGARTGLAAVVVGLLFLASLFFLPLFEPLQQLRFAYGPALMAVGVLMVGAVSRSHFDDLSEAVPALATVTMMLFTFNIANGLTAGLALYPVFKLLTGRWRDLNPGSWLLGGVCSAYFLFGLPH